MYSRCYIAYICNIRTKDIIETNPDIDEIFVFERDEYRKLWKRSKVKCIKKLVSFWKEIKKRRIDITLDLSLGKEYAFLCWLIGIRERRGFNHKGRGRFLTHKVNFDGFNDKPVAGYYLDLLEDQASDVRCQGKIKPVLVTTENDKAYIDDFLRKSGIKEQDVIIGIAPGGGISFGDKDKERRRWGAEKFSQLADRLVDKYGARIVLIWGPSEKDLVDKIAALMNREALIAPKTTIRQMAALCNRCKVVICSEGGPLHIASSQDVKTVSIFGPVDEKVYGPYPLGENNLVITSDVDCRPCYRRFKLPQCDDRICLKNISVDDVFGAISERIKI
ncbi:MAG: glycosyltransferase family 9 protein [Candidatus Omnitrophica bacterium]|nr:glycosyltransferase family 9 protein [Candidatus Omnitrophota bacterium]